MNDSFDTFARQIMDKYSFESSDNKITDLAMQIRLASAKVMIEILREYHTKFIESQS